MGVEPDPAPLPRRIRIVLLLATGAYLLFVVYGSLVPLQYRWVPAAEAWARFRSIPGLQLDTVSRADWIANTLLFIPLAFLGRGLLAARSRAGTAALASGFAWIACAALSVGIEYAQAYFPPRHVSLNDVLAESLGAGIGVEAWWFAGEPALSALGRWRALRREGGLAEWILWPYFALLAVCELLPLDLTLSPYDLVQKWDAGRIALVPFSNATPGLLQRGSALGAEALLWLPLAALWVLSGRGGPLVAWCLTVLVAAGVEVGQLFVYSRVSDVTDILGAAAGAAAGVWLAAPVRGRLPRIGAARTSGATAAASAGESRFARGALLGLVACVAWSLVMLVVFWSPFDFRAESATLRARLHLFLEVPFTAPGSGAELRSLAGALFKAAAFAPLGAGLAIACAEARGRLGRALCAAGSLALILCAAVGIELGQALLPSKQPSLADSAIEWSGGALGLWAVGAIRARIAARRPARNDA
jgi:VanZ family protein